MRTETPSVAKLEKLGVEVEKDGGLESLITQVDAAAMRQLITLRLGWTDAEANDFFDAPEHRPFTTSYKIPEDPSEAFRQFVIIGQYLHRRGDSNQLGSFCQAALDHLIAPQAIGIEDTYNGIDRQAVLRGTAFRPCQEALSLLKGGAGGDKDLLNEMLTVTENGNLDVVFDVLVSRQLSPNLRQALETVFARREADPRWSQAKLQLTWQAEALRLSMGIGLDDWLKLNGFDSAQKETERLEKLLEDWLVLGMRRVLGRGASFSFWQIVAERAQAKAEDLTVEEKKQSIRQLMSQLFPKAQESPRRLLAFADRPGASSRAWNIAYFNQNRQLAEVSLVNPRDQLAEAAGFAAHEVGGHNLHMAMLTQAGSPEKWLTLSGSLKNTLANLVQEQVRSLVELSRGQSQADDWWPLFRQRRQAPFGLTQMAVREEMEKIWAGGWRQARLTTEQLEAIAQTIAPRIPRWFATGINLIVPHATIYRNLNPANPVDGLVYTAKVERNPLERAFAKRFGDLWIDNPPARAVLQQVMAATAETEDLEVLARIAAGS